MLLISANFFWENGISTDMPITLQVASSKAFILSLKEHISFSHTPVKEAGKNAIITLPSFTSVERLISEPEAEFTGLRRGTSVRVATCLKSDEKAQRKKEGTLCTRCSGTGYKGRVGTYELLKITRPISNAIKKQLSTQEIEEIAISEGMLSLKKYAIKLIEKKITTIYQLIICVLLCDCFFITRLSNAFFPIINEPSPEELINKSL